MHFYNGSDVTFNLKVGWSSAILSHSTGWQRSGTGTLKLLRSYSAVTPEVPMQQVWYGAPHRWSESLKSIFISSTILGLPAGSGLSIFDITF